MNEQQLEFLEQAFPDGCVVFFFRKDGAPENVRIPAVKHASPRIDRCLDAVYYHLQEKLPEIMEKNGNAG